MPSRKKAERLAKSLLAHSETDAKANRDGLFREVCDRFAEAAQARPLALILDDMHWADQATLELLPQLARTARNIPMLIIVAYRSDGIPHGHPLRGMRETLRRARVLQEIALEPLEQGKGMLLVERLAGTTPSPELVSAILERSGGVPLFIEALVGVLKQRDGVADGVLPGALPLPETVREAMLARVDLLSPAGRRAAEAAAAGGSDLALDLLEEVNGSDDGIGELLNSGLLIEREPGEAVFRTPLAREAIYTATPWTWRRTLHRRFAHALERRGLDASQLAEHWQKGGEPERARRALREGATRARRLHAQGDAVQLLRRALDLWPAGQEEADRLAVLDQLGDCAQLTGQFTEALRAWREVAESAVGPENQTKIARALRKIANLYELNCEWTRALDARQDAITAFAAADEHAEAAAEGVTAAIRLRMSSRYAAALEVLARAESHAMVADKEELKVRIIGLKGNLEARLGRVDEGIAAIRAALETALNLDNAALAGEIYQRLADSIERSSRHRAAASVGFEGIAYCDSHGITGAAVACLTCLGWILVRSGEWKEALAASQRILESPASVPPARAGAMVFIGLVHVLRGELRKGEGLLLEAEAIARRVDHALCEIHARWGLAMHDALAGDVGSAIERSRVLLARCRTIDECHALIPVFRWASTCFAQAGERESLQACAELLSDMSATFGNAEPLSALAHSLGEMAWIDGDMSRAAEQFERAIQLIEDWDLPRERVESQLRAAAACSAAGRQDAAAAFAREASRGAKRLGARPLARAAHLQLRQLGAPFSGAHGKQGSRLSIMGGLTQRQLEVLAGISKGLTDKEIARSLRLSPRTVEMHVARTLAALDCRTRAQAVRKAVENGVLPK